VPGWPERIAVLWRPHPSIHGEGARQRARLTAGLLLALTALSAVTLLLPTLEEGSAWPPSDRWLVALLLLAMALGYGLAMAGRPNAGLVVAIGAMEAGTWSSRWALGSDGHGEPTLMFLVFPVLLAGVLLPTLWAAGVALGTLLVAWVLEGAIDQRLGRALDSEDVALALLIVGVSVLAVVASTMAQRQARQLDASVALLRQITDNVPEVLFVISADGKTVRFTSPAYEAMTGRTVAQSLADPLDWLKSVHPEDLPDVQARLQAGDSELEYRLIHQGNGAIRHVRARTFPVLGEGGRPVSLVGVVEDVTEARRAQAQVREAQRQRIHLLQQLAHDLGSPLTPVKIQLHLLRTSVGPEGGPGLEVVRRNVEHLARLVDDVRDVARLEGEGLRIERQDMDLVEVARQAVETLAPAAAEREVAVAVEGPLALTVSADAGRLTQVLYNLVGNAVKFTPRGGAVTITLSREDGEVRVDVRDSGSGMRPEQLARLFKPFSQVHDPGVIQRPEDKGTGLGLFITKGIVEAHGGRVKARSAGPGLGSTFTFHLPVAGPADGPR
jgi:PAS domain S-box-containing protein